MPPLPSTEDQKAFSGIELRAADAHSQVFRIMSLFSSVKHVSCDELFIRHQASDAPGLLFHIVSSFSSWTVSINGNMGRDLVSPNGLAAGLHQVGFELFFTYTSHKHSAKLNGK